jgi:hypothetical protein
LNKVLQGSSGTLLDSLYCSLGFVWCWVFGVQTTLESITVCYDARIDHLGVVVVLDQQ